MFWVYLWLHDKQAFVQKHTLGVGKMNDSVIHEDVNLFDPWNCVNS